MGRDEMSRFWPGRQPGDSPTAVSTRLQGGGQKARDVPQRFRCWNTQSFELSFSRCLFGPLFLSCSNPNFMRVNSSEK